MHLVKKRQREPLLFSPCKKHKFQHPSSFTQNTCHVDLQKEIQIFIAGSHGLMCLQLKLSDSIETIHEKIYQKTGIPRHVQGGLTRLRYSSKKFPPNATLYSLGIENNETLCGNFVTVEDKLFLDDISAKFKKYRTKCLQLCSLCPWMKCYMEVSKGDDLPKYLEGVDDAAAIVQMLKKLAPYHEHACEILLRYIRNHHHLFPERKNFVNELKDVKPDQIENSPCYEIFERNMIRYKLNKNAPWELAIVLLFQRVQNQVELYYYGFLFSYLISLCSPKYNSHMPLFQVIDNLFFLLTITKLSGFEMSGSILVKNAIVEACKMMFGPIVPNIQFSMQFEYLFDNKPVY